MERRIIAAFVETAMAIHGIASARPIAPISPKVIQLPIESIRNVFTNKRLKRERNSRGSGVC
jgi:hypothetical protein